MVGLRVVGTFWRADEQREPSELYTEFLRVPSMSAGIYRLVAGSSDPQRPHNEDEVYYVISGKGKLRAGDEIQEVRSGSIAFVPARETHRFEDIEEDLEVLVFFAPAETEA
jgi:mannose-6-phosphate isomerase-like protein (cupin superfamily)